MNHPVVQGEGYSSIHQQQTLHHIRKVYYTDINIFNILPKCTADIVEDKKNL
jgi:hypothetical protein